MSHRMSLSTALLLAVLACDSDPADRLLPPVVAEAPGGEKGKPGGGKDDGKTAEPLIEEYFITEVGGAQHIHLVASGSVSTVSASTMLDHFHNGVGDDDPPHDLHYEYYLPGSEEEPVPDMVDGLYHVDIPFSGTFREWDPGSETFVDVPLPDYPYLDVDGAGGDPWVFQIGVRSADSTALLRSRPDVTVGGNVVEHLVVDSVVVHHGETASNTISVRSLDVAGLSCRRTTVRSGKGKDRVVESVTRVEGNASFVLDGLDPGVDYPWVELHLVDEATGRLGPRQTITDDAASGLSLVLEVPGEPTSIDVVAVIDYVYADPAGGVYDPAENIVPTTAGASSDSQFAGIQAIGDPAPWARSAKVTVDCS